MFKPWFISVTVQSLKMCIVIGWRSSFHCDVQIRVYINSSEYRVVDSDDLSQRDVMMAKYLRSIALLAMLMANDNTI